MSEVITFKNKKTGETITLDKKVVSPAPVKNKSATIAEDIKSRGTIQGQIGSNLFAQSPLRKGVGALQTIGAPLPMIEAGIANPALAMQSGNFNPIDLGKEAIAGFTGQKLGQYGDVFRGANFPEPVAASLGLVLASSPLKALNMANKAFGKISKMSDKGILRAGDSLLSAVKNATTETGTKLEEAYKVVNDVTVNPVVFNSLLKRMPKPLLEEFENTIGKSIFANPTVGNLRKVKQIVGKYKPSIFGREERGMSENIEGEKLNQLYGNIKMFIDTVVTSKKGGSVAQRLSKADDAFTEVANASDYIQKTITDPTLHLATKGGAMAKKLALEGDVSGRKALNILKSSGARKAINKALSDLESFNKWQFVGKLAEHAAGAATFGGAIGGAGGYIGSKMYNRNLE
jgi:hypothetical protein